MKTPPNADFEPVYLLPPSPSHGTNRWPRYTLNDRQMFGHPKAQNEPPSPPRLPTTPLPSQRALIPQDTFSYASSSTSQHSSSEETAGEGSQASSTNAPRGILVSPQNYGHTRGKTHPQTNHTGSSITVSDIEESFRGRERSLRSFAESRTIPYRSHQKSQSVGWLRFLENENPQVLHLIAKEVHVNLVAPILAHKEHCKILSKVQQSSLPLFWQNKLLFDADVVALPAFISCLTKLPMARWPLLQKMQKAEAEFGFSPLGIEGMTLLADALFAVTIDGQQEIVKSVIQVKSDFGYLPIIEVFKAFASYPFYRGGYLAAATEIGAIYMGEDLSLAQFRDILADCFICSDHIQKNPSTKIEEQPSGCVSGALELIR